MTSDVGELIQERLPQWRAYARSLTRNRAAADDLVQDTIVRVLTSIEHFDGSNFASWSNAILRNRFIDDCRRARFQNGSVDNLPVAATAQPATQAFAVELEETMRALHKLPPKHRKILLLIAVNDLSYVGAARRLKIPLGTVRSRLARARTTLLAAVDGDGGDYRNSENAPNPMRSRCRRKYRSTRPIPQRALEIGGGRSHAYHGATELA